VPLVRLRIEHAVAPASVATCKPDLRGPGCGRPEALREELRELSRRQRGGRHRPAPCWDQGTREEVYQEWCDRHAWAFGHAYVMREDVRRLDARNIVDLLLTDLAGFRDVVELKRPDASVLRADPSHGSYYFSSDASRAIGQVHKYMDVLHDTMSRSLEAHPLLVAYHPRATIVIGRSHKWCPEQTRALRGLNARMHDITVMTYDHLVAQAKQLLRVVSDDRLTEAPERRPRIGGAQPGIGAGALAHRSK
jgi:hypothetical protein